MYSNYSIRRLTLCVDLDGVLLDLNRTLGKRLGMDFCDCPWPVPGEYNVSAAFGITHEQVMEGMRGVEFWHEIPTFSWGFPLIKYLETNIGQKNIIILTKPTKDGDAYKGKFEWVEKNLPQYVDQLLIGTPKQACARMEDGILIDDSDFNIDRFNEFGGQGILFAQPWNKRHAVANERLKVLHSDLQIMLNRYLPPMDFQ